MRARRRRGQGPAKIRAELEQRRVDKAVVAQHLDDLESGWLRDAVEWLERQKAGSLGEMKGAVSLEAKRDPGAFERAQYIRTLHSWTR